MLKKKICILTATRAEYGLLRPIILKLIAIHEFDVRVVVTGAHLSPEFGSTYQEIEKDGIAIDDKIEILLSSDTPAAISKSMGLAIIGFADYFTHTNPDLLIVLGDRYETLAVCSAALHHRIPIAHLHGGETTEGAVDESIRHAISKLSYIHFTSTKNYRNRVIQLGEDPSRVFAVGAIGVENVLQQQLLTRDELAESIGFDLSLPYVVVTFHPVTLENDQSAEQTKTLLSTFDRFPDLRFLISKANADTNGRMINRLIDEYVNAHSNAIAFDSLGATRYLSAIKSCDAVIGNSSSGIIEAPSFGIPTVNIGDRQKGRIQADSIINCAPETNEIEQAIRKALSEDFKKIAQESSNPYEGQNTSDKIVRTIRELLSFGSIDLKKKFYDIEVQE